MNELIQKILDYQRHPNSWLYKSYCSTKLAFDVRDVRENPGMLFLLSDRMRKIRETRKEVDTDRILQALHLTQQEKIDLLGLLSLSSNGYFRETALDLLSSFKTAYVLPFVALRLQDWVPPVRKAAEKIFISHAKYGRISDWEKSAFLFNRILGRRHGGEINRLLMNHFRPRFPAVDRAGWFLSADKEMRRLLWGLFSNEELKNVATPEFIRSEFDPKLAGEIFSRLTNILPRETVIQAGIHHTSNKIRYQALQALYQDRGAELKSITEKALTDKSANVRDLARFIYHSYFGKNAKDHFESFNVPPDDEDAQLGYVLGWLESTNENPNLFLEFHKKSPRAKIRAASLMAYARVGGYTPEAPALMITALESDSHSRGIAAKLVKMGWASGISQSIWELADKELGIKRKLWLIRLAAKADRQESLMPALRRMPRALPVIQAELFNLIEKWSRLPQLRDLNQSQKIEGRQLVEQVKLDRRLKEWLKFLFI